MATRMLIDARHREETRVAVVQNNRIEEFDFESAQHKQLKGNIYLAKVTRVEASLQAAFVDYGGNRHGFLAFSEIHPDYYQIPESDRQALLAEEAEHAREEAELRDDADDAAALAAEEGDEIEDVEDAVDEAADEDAIDVEEGDADEPGTEETEEGDEPAAATDPVEEQSMQDLRRRRMNLRRRYKIQDVIHRRQLLLVQVVKEERGNKGAALTTYLSLAGRYCVLMPNTSHGGGISRKISSAADRKRLKSVVSEFRLPPTMGCIVRTAGMTRTKAEIKRDFTYLARLWDDIRAATLKATAPARIHADSDLIKRAIRDIYNREIEEVIVEGDDGYKAARDFMKLLMPSHARRVKPYADPTPLFQRYHVEDQLGAMFQPLVQLKSGGYLVINPTEALVSIDINSGRSTREYNIEQTALKTNIEAAREIARQLRLRDMAGLVVIDFIDMDHHSNNRKVEKALKDALKDDRARIQVGRISSFGLLEMSRQRLRTGVLEASTTACPHCEGTGLMRTAASAGLSGLRVLEEEAAKGRGSQLTLCCGAEAAVYLLNAKRGDLVEIEERYGVTITVVPDSRLEGAAMNVEAAGPPPERRVELAPIALEDDEEVEAIEDEEEEDEDEEQAEDERPAESDRGARRRRSRRGGRGRSRRDEGREEGRDEPRPADTSEGVAEEDGEYEPREAAASPDVETDEEGAPRRSRRGRRGGRRRRPEAVETVSDEASTGAADAEIVPDEAPEPEPAEAIEPVSETPEVEVEAPAPRRRTRRKAAVSEEAETPAEPEARPARARRTRKPAAPVEAETPAAPANDDEEAAPAPEAEAPKRARRPRKVEAEAEAAEPAEPSGEDAPSGEDGSPRQGWWQRTFGT